MAPPQHVRLRRLVHKGFTPRMVAQLEPRVREITNQILDAVAPRGACDFVTDIAALLPLAVICALMGVPREDWGLMFTLTNRRVRRPRSQEKVLARYVLRRCTRRARR